MASIKKYSSLSLSDWDLPETVLQNYHENGITSLFEWQLECLQLPGVLLGRNLVYSAPTSAGKTLVAELLLLKRVLQKKKKAIFIVPFVSMAKEKTHYLQRVFGSCGVVVEGFMGGQVPAGGLSSVDVAVCTIEKANNLCNRLLQAGELGEVGVVVVDELHLVADGQRGYLLELLLTKLRFSALKAERMLSVGSITKRPENPEENTLKEGKTDDTHPSSLAPASSHDSSQVAIGNVLNSPNSSDVSSQECFHGLQVIGMSATLPNLSLLAEWLQAALYVTNHRPVPLTHLLLCEGALYTPDMAVVRKLKPDPSVKTDPDQVLQLCVETLLEGFSVLVFCSSRARCETLAVAIAKHIFTLGSSDSGHPLQEAVRRSLDPDALLRVLQALQDCPAGLDKALACSLQYGTAFHHAGLTTEERDIVEASYRSGIVRVLVATTTLSSGVNLPARRVLIRSPYFGAGRPLDPLAYHQMAGRAGRKGVDTQGECVLVCSGRKELEVGRSIIKAPLPQVSSCLAHSAHSLSAALKRALLEVVVSGAATSVAELKAYCRCTLLAACLRRRSQEAGDGDELGGDAVHSCIKYLLDNEFICRSEGELSSSPLGRAVLRSGLSPDEGLLVFAELHTARRCLVLDTDFHLVMLVTPIYISCNPDWMALLEVWEGLPEAVRRVASLLGVRESFIVQAVKGTVNAKLEQQAVQLRLQKRFYTALALHDLLQEMPLPAVATKFNINKGLLQSLQQSAATFAGMVKVFSSCLGWRSLALLVQEFEGCLQFGVRPELCELVQLEHVSSTTARRLYDAGITTLHKLAKTSHRELVLLLEKSMPFASRVHGDELAASKKKRRAAAAAPEGGGQVWVEGVGWTSIAREAHLILADARTHLMKQVGVRNVHWEDDDVQASRCDAPLRTASSLDSGTPCGSGSVPTTTVDGQEMQTPEAKQHKAARKDTQKHFKQVSGAYCETQYTDEDGGTRMVGTDTSQPAEMLQGNLKTRELKRTITRECSKNSEPRLPEKNDECSKNIANEHLSGIDTSSKPAENDEHFTPRSAREIGSNAKKLIQAKASSSGDQVTSPARLNLSESFSMGGVNVCDKNNIPVEDIVINTINQKGIGSATSLASSLIQGDLDDSILLLSSHVKPSLIDMNNKTSCSDCVGKQGVLQSTGVCKHNSTAVVDSARVSSTLTKPNTILNEKKTQQSTLGRRRLTLDEITGLEFSTCSGGTKTPASRHWSPSYTQTGGSIETASLLDDDLFAEEGLSESKSKDLGNLLDAAGVGNSVKSNSDLFSDDEEGLNCPPTLQLCTAQETGHSGVRQSLKQNLSETHHSMKKPENVRICSAGKNSSNFNAPEVITNNVNEYRKFHRVSERTVGIQACNRKANSGAVDGPYYHTSEDLNKNASETCNEGNLPLELEESLLAMSLSPWTNSAPLVSTVDIRDEDDGHLSPDTDCNVTFSCDIENDVLQTYPRKSIPRSEICNTSVANENSVSLGDVRWQNEMSVDDDDIFSNDKEEVRVTTSDDFNDSLDINGPNLYSQSTPAGLVVSRFRLSLSSGKEDKHEHLKRESMLRSRKVYEPQLDLLSVEGSCCASLNESVLESLSDLHISAECSRQNRSYFSREDNVVNSSNNSAHEHAERTGHVTIHFEEPKIKSIGSKKPNDFTSSFLEGAESKKANKETESKNADCFQPLEDDMFDEFDVSDPNAISGILTPILRSSCSAEKAPATDSSSLVASEIPALRTKKQQLFQAPKVEPILKSKTKRLPLVNSNQHFRDEKRQTATDHFVRAGKENVQNQPQSETVGQIKINSLNQNIDPNSSSENEFSHLVTMEEEFFKDISGIAALMDKTFKAFDGRDASGKGLAPPVSPSSLTLNLSKDEMLESSQQDTNGSGACISSPEISHDGHQGSQGLNCKLNTELVQAESAQCDHSRSNYSNRNDEPSNSKIWKDSESVTAGELKFTEFPIKKDVTDNRYESSFTTKKFCQENELSFSNRSFHKNFMKNMDSDENFDEKSIHIIHLSSNIQRLQEFLEELDSKDNFSLILIQDKQPVQNENTEHAKSDADDGEVNSTRKFEEGQSPQRLHGVVVAYNEREAHYLQLTEHADLLDIKIRRDALRRIIGAGRECKRSSARRRGAVVLWECCAALCVLWRATGAMPSRPLKDVSTAAWMLGEPSWSLAALVDQYLPQKAWLCRSDSSPVFEEGNGKADQRSSVSCAAQRAVATLLLLEALEQRLHKRHLHQHWVMVEMPCAAVIAKLQLNGMGFSAEHFQQTVRCVQRLLSELEQDAHRACGRVFKLSSFGDLAAVLYKTLRLPPPKDWKRRLSKETLAGLREHHALPGIVLQWRKLHAALHKMLLPLEKQAIPNTRCGASRVHPCCHRHTSTGRVNMAEPSLQCVPRDVCITTEHRRSASSNKFTTPLMEKLLFSRNKTQAREKPVETVVSCRRVIAARAGCVLLAADYCQLELRVLAHCSKDARLKKLLSEDSERDVFLRIAAEILSSDSTSNIKPQRDVAKQLCYAVIYGMGSKALAAQLNTTDEEASQKRQKFLKTFPGISSFMKETVDRARVRGYVATIMGRRRLLDNIDSPDSALRSQSERQAVNSVIQGSAADIVKAAMVSVDAAITERYPRQPCVLADADVSDAECFLGDAQAHLVLQLHDELMYEVRREELLSVAVLLKGAMERTTHLDVPLPVKLKAGDTWGDMDELKL